MIRIVSAEFISSAVKPSQYPSSEFADIAFVGKSNVGKSSMMNTIMQRKSLAKTSSTPGKTKLVNFFKIRAKRNEDDFYLNFVDLPGYGYAKVSLKEKDSWKVMMNKYFTERIQLRGVLSLVDIRHKADEKDTVMINMLQSLNIPVLVVATKCDKIPKNKVKATLEKLKKQHNAKKIIAFSSLKKIGTEPVLAWMEGLLF